MSILLDRVRTLLDLDDEILEISMQQHTLAARRVHLTRERLELRCRLTPEECAEYERAQKVRSPGLV